MAELVERQLIDRIAPNSNFLEVMDLCVGLCAARHFRLVMFI